MRYFLDDSQHTSAVQAVAAFVNMKLPYQKHEDPPRAASNHQPSSSNPAADPHIVLLVPYIRRLVVTAFDSPAILHGFFGNDWAEGIGPIHETERRNYLFAAKSDPWLSVKASYDMEDGQMVPFLRPLRNVTVAEIEAAESGWSEWLAMQDWMLGPRAPPSPPNGG